MPVPQSTARSGGGGAQLPSQRRPKWQGFWRLADPKISITSLAALSIGTAVAASSIPVNWFWLGILAAALFCMEVAKNAWGDVIDFDSGNDLAVAPEDRTAFSGGKRVLVDNLLTRSETWLIAGVFGGTGLLLGAAIVFLHEASVFWLGTVGLVVGWSYHGPPLQLCYRGFGELAVFAVYGPILVLSTTQVLTGELSLSALLLSVPLGLLITAFLWVNEFPDFAADRQAGKRNLVARLGRHRASRLLPLLYLGAFGVLLLMVYSGYSSWLLLGALALPTALFACVMTWRSPEDFYRFAPVQPAALLSFVIYSGAVSAGWLIAYAG